MCFAPQWRALFRHLNFQKWSEHGGCVLYILTWKCASRHNGVHFFDISTSKSGPTLVCFVHFDLEMCFPPQWRALFRHRNVQKWSEPLAFCTFWLGNVLRATTACIFSQLPKVVRSWGVLHILTSKCASRHNSVQFFISHLAAGSAPAALASLLFDPPEPQIIGKTQCFATFLPFRAPRSSFFWDFLFFDLLSSSLLFSNSSHLCFSFVHIVGSFTSKLPSVIYYISLYGHILLCLVKSALFVPTLPIHLRVWSFISLSIRVSGRVGSASLST